MLNGQFNCKKYATEEVHVYCFVLLAAFIVDIIFVVHICMEANSYQLLITITEIVFFFS